MVAAGVGNSSVQVIGNWKMNGSQQLLAGFSDRFSRGQAAGELAGIDIGLCLPHTLLAAFPGDGVLLLGAQNLSQYDEGAYTGEVSAGMLVETGCQLVLVGHSERREHFGETSAVVAMKAERALAAGIRPLICVGESGEEREAGQTFERLEEQLDAVLIRLNAEQIGHCWFAYEPVWAIGTGQVASPAQAQEVHAWIRRKLPKFAQTRPILYGGSVKAENAAALLTEQDIDGVLVGGASLNLEEFYGICRAAADLVKRT